MKNKNFYIFDLLHTLTGPESGWASLPTTSEFLGIDRKIWNDFLHFGTYDRLCGRERDPLHIIRNIVDRINPQISDEKVLEAVENRKKRFGQSLINIPVENVNTLKKLKESGKKLGLLSNADVMEVAMWDKSPLAELFDSTVFSCNVGYAKPDKEIYEISLKELGATPDEVVFIGDGGSNELQGAKEAGLTTVMITGIIEELWPEKIPERKKWADHIIERIAELNL